MPNPDGGSDDSLCFRDWGVNALRVSFEIMGAGCAFPALLGWLTGGLLVPFLPIPAHSYVCAHAVR